ncbi:MAG: GAF domain-containing protein [Anaerolineae bacterium]|nr:MAG: GAF domain-containing protein [Anaerolineae bacterium]
MRSDLIFDVVLLGVAVLVVAAVVFSRRRRRRAQAVAGQANGVPLTTAMVADVFSFHRRLLAARDAETIIHVALQTVAAYLQAQGCSFVPFNEWRPSLPALVEGRVPETALGDWSSRLVAPEVRQACKLCHRHHAEGECVLLDGAQDRATVFCLPLRFQGREVGMMNFYDVQREVDDDARAFLDEVTNSLELALDAVQFYRQERFLLEVAEIEKSRDDDLLPATNNQPLPTEFRAVIEERARLAREIHDGLAQTLAFLKLEAARMKEYLERGQEGNLVQTLEGFYRTLSDAYLDARQAIDDLRRVPTSCLPDWLHQVAEDFEALTGIAVAVEADVQRELSPGVQAQLLRIVQEALTNVRKHAHARSVVLAAWEAEDALFLEIRDDGVGFPPQVACESRYGLRGMRERAEMIGADFQVISQAGQGATVHLRLPLERVG